MSSAEGAFGWIRVGCGTAVVAVLPLWVMLTALFLNVDEETRQAPLVFTLPIAAGLAAFWLGLAIILVVVVLLFVRGLGRVGAMRDQAERVERDAEIAKEATLPADAWDAAPVAPDVQVPSDDGETPEPEPEPDLPDDVTDATEEVEW